MPVKVGDLIKFTKRNIHVHLHRAMSSAAACYSITDWLDEYGECEMLTEAINNDDYFVVVETFYVSETLTAYKFLHSTMGVFFGIKRDDEVELVA